MFCVVTTSGWFGRWTARRLSSCTRHYLREVARADLGWAVIGCAVFGVLVAGRIRFGSNVTHPSLALSLALPMLWIAASRRPGAYDVRHAVGECLHGLVAMGRERLPAYGGLDAIAVAAEQRKERLPDSNDSNGVLSKLRQDLPGASMEAYPRRWPFALDSQILPNKIAVMRPGSRAC